MVLVCAAYPSVELFIFSILESSIIFPLGKRLTAQIMQVAGKVELVEILGELFSNAKLLEAHRLAAKQAFHALSSGIIKNVWNLLDFHVFRKAVPEIQTVEQQS